MKGIDTALLGSMMKHANAMNQDPFSANYTQSGGMDPVAPPPGSIAATRIEDQQAQIDQDQQKAEEATAKAQEEAKAKEQQLKALQGQVDGVNKEYEKAQQQAAELKAKVDAYEARDAIQSPGLSPSFEATKKRMTASVGQLGKNMRKFAAMGYVARTAHLMEKRAWWSRYEKLDKPDQIVQLVKLASMVAPSTGVPKTKPAGGSSVVKEQRDAGSIPTTREATAYGINRRSYKGVQIPEGMTKFDDIESVAARRPQQGKMDTASALLQPQVTPPTNTATTPAPKFNNSQAMADHYGGAKGMNDAQRAQYKGMLKNEMDANAAQNAPGMWNNFKRNAKAVGGMFTPSGMSELAGKYGSFFKDPAQYTKDNLNTTAVRDSMFDALGGDPNDHAWSMGNIIPTLGRGVGTAADWIKNPLTRAGGNLMSGLTAMPRFAINQAVGAGKQGLGQAGAYKDWALGNAKQIWQNKDDENVGLLSGVDWNPSDNMREAGAAGRQQQLEGWKQLGKDTWSGLKGVGSVALMGTGGGIGTLGRAVTAPMLGGVAGGIGFGGALEDAFDGQNSGGHQGHTRAPEVVQPGSPEAAAADKAKPVGSSGGGQGSPAVAPNLNRVDQTRQMLQKGMQNPNTFAQRINSFSGYQNAPYFPQSGANVQIPGQDSLLGQVSNYVLSQFGAPDTQSFHQGFNAPLRNSYAPYDQMQAAMNAFGQNAAPYPVIPSNYPGY